MPGHYNEDLANLVKQTIRTLYNKGVSAADLVPLVKLHDAVKAPDAPSAAFGQPGEMHERMGEGNAPRQAEPSQAGVPYDRDGRRCKDMLASEALLARASAIIDVLVQSGQSPEQAAQIITRQLLSVGIQVPDGSGDARAWKRLLNWRNALIHYKRAGSAWDTYCAFKEQLAHIPPDRRLRMAVGERLWDQRQEAYSSQNIA